MASVLRQRLAVPHMSMPQHLAVLFPPVAASKSWRRLLASAVVGKAPTVKLYQYEICPFCCKVKAFMDWQRLPYSTIEVNPLTKAELKFSEQYKKVPIAVIDGMAVNDSSGILSTLAQGNVKEDLSNEETEKWLRWVDKELAVLLFPNITRSFSESFQAFRYIGEVQSFGLGAKAANQLAGSFAMWLANGKLKKKYNIVDERKQLRETLQSWTDAVGGGPFLRGDELSVPDVAVYGVLSSIRGLATYEEILAASPELKKWIANVRVAIGSSMRQEATPVARSFGLTAP